MENNFKKHKIVRKCDKHYADYHSYKRYLRLDFSNRCAYCNLNEEWIKPLSFQIDHFIPRSAFEKAKRMDLENDYDNLMYACPICNRAKTDMFAGQIPPKGISNPYFYNPVEKDYNKIFYRDEEGRILSDDELGKNMISYLQLHRPTKQLAWYLDELHDVYRQIEARLENETDLEIKESLSVAYEKIGNTLFRKHRYFVHSYVTEKSSKL